MLKCIYFTTNDEADDRYGLVNIAEIQQLLN